MTREVTLVYGPPCGGKSTYVYRNAKQGDRIIDVDRLCRAAGSTRDHLHDEEFWGPATVEFWRQLDEVGADDNARAWIIRCAPTRWERERVATRARVTHVVMCAPRRFEAIRRCGTSGRDTETLRLIHNWYARHEPGPV